MTIYRLKNTSDCIKIDPPGPGWNLKKSRKKVKKNELKMLLFFYFCRKNICFWVFFWVCPFGARPFGARWAGPPLLLVKRKYWKSSEEKVPLKMVFYFFTKIKFLVILPIKTLWDLSKTTDLVEIIRMQFFCPKLIGER